MKRFPNRTTEAAGRSGGRARGGIAVTVAFLGLAACCWLPVRAQERPATGGSANTPAANAPAAKPPGGSVTGLNGPLSPGNTPDVERGSNQGTKEPGPPNQGQPEGGSREVGQPAGERGGVGGEGEPKKETKEFSIHLPTWISGVLKKFWFSGPATLNAAGAVDEQGAPVDGAGLKGQPVDFEYEDHHSELEPKPRYPIHPTIGEIGKATPGSGAKTARITVGGRRITLVNPDVTFAYASMFPEPLVISLLTALCIALVAILLARNLNRVPDRKQAALELAYLFLDDKIRELIGPHYKRYVPFVATLFIYILVMNLVGLIPGWASPTANVNVTAGLAIVVILYVQYEGIRVNGLGGYLMHFVGEPKWLAPLNFPLHVMGEVARVLSLTIRLFGNIFGEDVVIVILVALAAMFTKGIVPFQFPILFLAAFTSLVQAAVFSILTCVYIALMTTHEDHGGHPDEHGHGGDPGHVHDAAAPATAA